MRLKPRLWHFAAATALTLGLAPAFGAAHAEVTNNTSVDLSEVVGGDEQRVCLDYDWTCTYIWKNNNDCPTSSVCAPATCESVTGDKCAPSESQCDDITVKVKYCFLVVTDTCVEIGTAGCGEIETGTCSYVSQPTPNLCADGSIYIQCNKQPCQPTGSEPCLIPLCL